MNVTVQIFTSLIRLADRHRLVLSSIAIISDLNCQFYEQPFAEIIVVCSAGGGRATDKIQVIWRGGTVSSSGRVGCTEQWLEVLLLGGKYYSWYFPIVLVCRFA